MLIPTTAILDWKDLQDKVAELFCEMGYDVRSPHVVTLVRGAKEIDVYVTDPRTSVRHVILIECKHWASAVKQETVHGFHTVMRDCEANTGIIVSSCGFQSGAAEAVANSNIQLKTWESLQTAYGNEWYLRQRERLASLKTSLQQIDGAYLDQWETPKSISNLMRFEHLGRLADLYDLLAQGRMLLLAMMAGPTSYDQPGPIETNVLEGWPGAGKDKYGLPVLRHDDVRAWFRWIRENATSLVARVEAFEIETIDAFEALDASEAEVAFKTTLDAISEETPIRVLRDLVDEEEYERLVGLIRSNRPSAR